VGIFSSNRAPVKGYLKDGQLLSNLKHLTLDTSRDDLDFDVSVLFDFVSTDHVYTTLNEIHQIIKQAIYLIDHAPALETITFINFYVDQMLFTVLPPHLKCFIFKNCSIDLEYLQQYVAKNGSNLEKLIYTQESTCCNARFGDTLLVHFAKCPNLNEITLICKNLTTLKSLSTLTKLEIIKISGVSLSFSDYMPIILKNKHLKVLEFEVQDFSISFNQIITFCLLHLPVIERIQAYCPSQEVTNTWFN